MLANGRGPSAAGVIRDRSRLPRRPSRGPVVTGARHRVVDVQAAQLDLGLCGGAQHAGPLCVLGR
jgi:hypothetical protein